MDAEMRRGMAGQMNGLFTRANDTKQAMDGIAGRDLWEASRIRRETAQAAAEKPAEKQVKKEEESSTVRAVRTKIAANRSVQEKYQEQVSEERAAEAETEAITKQLEWVGDSVVPEDVEDLDDEGSYYEEYTAEQLERAIQRVKDGRAAKQAGVERQVEKKQETREQLEQASLSEAEQKLAEKLEAAGMPVTQANLEKLAAALGMAEQAVGGLGERSYSYLLENGLESSIENLYRASLFGGSGNKTAESSFAGSSAAGGADGELWAQLEPQAAAALEREGIPVSEESMQEARWLFEHGLPIDGRNMAELQSLKGLTNRAETDASIDSGNSPQRAGVSGTSAFNQNRAADARQSRPNSQSAAGAAQRQAAGLAGREGTVQNEAGSTRTEPLQDEIIEKLVDQTAVGGKPTETILGDAREREAEYAAAKWNQMDFSNITQVTMRRQLEEVRLKMTTEAALQLLKKGIRLDTENLNQIVAGLKELEQNYYQKLCQEQGAGIDDQTAALLQDVAEKRQESFAFSIYAMGSVYRSSGQITFEAFYEEGRQLTARLEQDGTEVERIGDQRIGERQARAEEAYETMATEIRSDLGDSIKKAFRSVDSLLESMEMAVNEANERAVRILGYNSLEITPESVAQMRYYDSRVTETLREMKPGTVLKMIRSGQNPLQMSMEELGDVIRELSDQDMGEESRSRFLWNLEKQHAISEEERSSYIGIYRLLHQIEKSDGAAIGAVVEAGQELTLQNLLTAVRTSHSGGIDQRADETTGERESAARKSASITEQIAAGYKKLDQDLAAETARQLRQTLEEPEKDYREWQAEHLAEQVADSQEAVSFLQEYGIESTPVLLEAAKELLGADRQLEDFIKGLPAAEREQLEQESKRVLDSLGKEETEAFQAQVRQLQESVLRQIEREKTSESESIKESERAEGLEASSESREPEGTKKSEARNESGASESENQVLTFERLQQLRTLGRAMNLSERLTGQEHYEIPVIREDGSVSRIRLTVRHESSFEHTAREKAGSEAGVKAEASTGTASGTMELSMKLPETGQDGEAVKGSFWLQGGRLEGYFRCESREAQGIMEQKLEHIREALEAAGFETGSLTCHLTGGRSSYHPGINRAPEAETVQAGRQIAQQEETAQRSAQAIQQSGQNVQRAAQTVQLYQAARAVIDVIGEAS